MIKHIALVCGSEENADKFYRDLLGLEKSDPIMLPVELTRAIFRTEATLTLVNYTDTDTHFEIFVTGGIDTPVPKIEHVCLEIDRMEPFLEKCRSLNLQVNQVPRGDRFLTFVTDDDGNLFEIKSDRS